MLISQAYKQYLIPINLQEHMLRVAAVGDIICESVDVSLGVDRDLVVKTLLLHDMGNILKYDLSKTDLLAEGDKKRVSELKKIKEEFLDKYGEDTDKATLEIMSELGVEKEAIELCGNSHGEQSDQFVGSDEWERKIAYYCDMRIGPFGVKRVEDRFGDLIGRNPGEKVKLEEYLKRCLKIERQLQEVVSIDLQKIDDEMIEGKVNDLLKIEI